MPNSVSTIGEGAFSGCGGLRSMTLPFVGSSRTSSGASGVFGYIFGTSSADGCKSVLQYYTSSNSKTSYIPSGLQSVTITDVAQLSYGAFYNCTMLETVILPASMTSLGEKSFYNCSGLKLVPLPSSLNTIGASAFYGCASLSSVTIPASMTRIGTSAFYNCSGLKAVYISSLEKWCGIAFANRTANPVYYAKNLYLDNQLVTTLSIPDTIETIGSNVFCGLGQIKTLTIPASVKNIGEGAFYGWTSLESITLPFVGASRTASGSTGVLGYIFGYTSSSVTGTIYQQYAYKNGYYYYIPAALKSVTVTDTDALPYGAFYNCSSITTFVFSEKLKSIGDYAFYNCWQLQTLPSFGNITSIGASAFNECSGLTSVTLPTTLVSIGEDAFLGCSKLTGVYIQDLAAWCRISFGNTSANPVYTAQKLYLNKKLITALVIPKEIDVIPAYAFCGAESVTSLKIEGSLSKIGDYAFCQCKGLATITYSGPVVTFGSYAFSGCTNLKSIVIPDGAEQIMSYAFASCSSVTTIIVPNTVLKIDSAAFYGCNKLTALTVPSISGPLGRMFGSRSESGDGTTLQCNGPYVQHRGYYYIPSTLRTVTITKDTSFGYGAFYNCTMLTSVVIKAPVQSFGEKCFSGCSLTVSVPSCMDKNLAKTYSAKKLTWKYYNAVSLEDADIQPIEDQFYTASAIEPAIQVTLNGTTLKQGTDYTVTMKNNTALGIATVLVTGTGKYIGTCEATFRIVPMPVTSATITVDLALLLSASPGVCPFKVTCGSNALTPETDFSAEYRCDMNGNGVVVINGKGNYTGTAQKAYQIEYLHTLCLPNGLTAIEEKAFAGIACQYAVIPDSCTTIGRDAFADCSRLCRIWIPQSVTSIDRLAFSGCGQNLVIIAPAGSFGQMYADAYGYRYEQAMGS